MNIPNPPKNSLCICQNRVFALIWRCLTLFACLYGLYPILFGASFSGQSLCYFTIQSNLLLAALLLALAAGSAVQLFRTGARGDAFHLPPFIQLAVVFYVQITFLVFAFMLSGSAFSMGSGIGFSNILLHYIAPVMALIDWLLFMPHGGVCFRHAAIWLIFPAAYVVFAFIRADLGAVFWNGSRFPYFFMDADVLGWNLIWIFPAFFAAFFALASFVTAIDKLLARVLRKKELSK